MLITRELDIETSSTDIKIGTEKAKSEKMKEINSHPPLD